MLEIMCCMKVTVALYFLQRLCKYLENTSSENQQNNTTKLQKVSEVENLLYNNIVYSRKLLSQGSITVLFSNIKV